MKFLTTICFIIIISELSFAEKDKKTIPKRKPSSYTSCIFINHLDQICKSSLISCDQKILNEIEDSKNSKWANGSEGLQFIENSDEFRRCSY